MLMDKLTTFFDMGGYAVWVWSAYGVSVVALVGMVVLSLRSLRAREREFEMLKASRRGSNEGLGS
jgi:heme exporter protein D